MLGRRLRLVRREALLGASGDEGPRTCSHDSSRLTFSLGRFELSGVPQAPGLLDLDHLREAGRTFAEVDRAARKNLRRILDARVVIGTSPGVQLGDKQNDALDLGEEALAKACPPLLVPGGGR